IKQLKEKNLELTKENYILRNKFKHVSEIFRNKTETELLDKYFPKRSKLEKIIKDTVKKLFKKEFDLVENKVLYFRKFFKTKLKRALFHAISAACECDEKLSKMVTSIAIKEQEPFIYSVVAQHILEKIEDDKGEEFLDTLIHQQLIDKDEKYEPITFNYKIDEIKNIIRNYHSIKSQENIETISIVTELEEIKNQRKALEKEQEELQQEFEQLEKEENELLATIVASEGGDETTKARLDEIDEKKREIKDRLFHIAKEIDKLKNREIFITPLIDSKKTGQIDEKEIRYKEKYDKLISDFANALIVEL
ncbi:MAG: hypothetical protein GXO40_05595, partial [Epsilonproteobacteria bacterium]|nr:hypothetical protein [Campylobacterota bacterium]